MAMRVASFPMNDKMLQASLRTQAKMADMQLQQASGLVSTDYGGLGGSARNLVSLEVSLQRSKTYASAGNEALDRVEIMYSTLSSVTDILTDFRSRITAQASVNTDDTSMDSFVSTAQSYLQELASALNVQYEGRYLFAGSLTTQLPVDLTDYAATDTETASTDYYQGDGVIASVQVSGQQSVSYGVTADNPAFEQAFRALSFVANSGGELDSDALESVADLVVSALESATAVQSMLSVDAATLERSAAAQEDYQSFVTENISDVKNVDVTAIAVTLTTYQTQLEASYAAIGKLASLSLLDYLR